MHLRGIAVVATLCALASVSTRADDAAQAPAAKPALPASQTISDGKVVDAYWQFTYALRGLTPAKTRPSDAWILFQGTAGDVSVAICVRESDHLRTNLEWREHITGPWNGKWKGVEEASGGTPIPWKRYVERFDSGAERRHAYGFVTRGLHGFVIHAWSDAKADVAAASLAPAIAGLSLGEDAGASVAAQDVGRRFGRDPGAPETLRAAGWTYIDWGTKDGMNYGVMAEVVLTRALLRAKPGDLTDDQIYGVHMGLGEATLLQRKPIAVKWLKRALVLAEKTTKPAESRASANYDLACAHAVAGDVDDAFAALEQAYVGTAPVTLTHLRGDADVANLHKDPRWGPFLAFASAKGPR